VLELILLDGSERRFALAENTELMIGAAANCAVRLAALDVSRNHALLTCRGDRVLVLDLGSRNGTYLNGRRIKEAEAVAGDVLRFSSVMTQLVPPEGIQNDAKIAAAAGESGGSAGSTAGLKSLTSDTMPALVGDSLDLLLARWASGRQGAQAGLVEWLVGFRKLRGAAVLETLGSVVTVVAAHGEVSRVLEDPECAELVRGRQGVTAPEGFDVTLAGQHVLALKSAELPWLVLVPSSATPDVAELSLIARLLAVARRLDGVPAGGPAR
jgi:hypothetical protein